MPSLFMDVNSINQENIFSKYEQLTHGNSSLAAMKLLPLLGIITEDLSGVKLITHSKSLSQIGVLFSRFLLVARLIRAPFSAINVVFAM